MAHGTGEPRRRSTASECGDPLIDSAKSLDDLFSRMEEAASPEEALAMMKEWRKRRGCKLRKAFWCSVPDTENPDPNAKKLVINKKESFIRQIATAAGLSSDTVQGGFAWEDESGAMKPLTVEELIQLEEKYPEIF